MITADTITNEQIRELRSSLLAESRGDLTGAILECDDALSETRHNDRAYYRARCAAVLNARSSSTSTRGYANPRVHAAVYQGATFEDFTEQDWLDLAIAALDQAGLSARDQRGIEKTAREAFEYSGHARAS